MALGWAQGSALVGLGTEARVGALGNGTACHHTVGTGVHQGMFPEDWSLGCRAVSEDPEVAPAGRSMYLLNRPIVIWTSRLLTAQNSNTKLISGQDRYWFAGVGTLSTLRTRVGWVGAVARTALGWVRIWVAGDSLSKRACAAACQQQPEPPHHVRAPGTPTFVRY